MNAPAQIVPPYKHTPLFPLGKDKTPYRKLTGAGRAGREDHGPRHAGGRARGDPRAGGGGVHRHQPSAAARATCKQLRVDPRRHGGERERQVRRLRLPQERQHRGRRRAADVPGHRHRDHHGQEGPAWSSPTATTRRRSPRARATPTSSATCAIRSSRRSRCSRRRTPRRTCRRRSRSTPRASDHDDEYKFLFIAKGGGSANKSFLFQATPSILTHDRMIAFLKEKILTLGTAACPPYHLAIVIGGTSAELTMKTVKLASARYLRRAADARLARTATPSAISRWSRKCTS